MSSYALECDTSKRPKCQIFNVLWFCLLQLSIFMNDWLCIKFSLHRSLSCHLNQAYAVRIYDWSAGTALWLFLEKNHARPDTTSGAHSLVHQNFGPGDRFTLGISRAQCHPQLFPFFIYRTLSLVLRSDRTSLSSNCARRYYNHFSKLCRPWNLRARKIYLGALVWRPNRPPTWVEQTTHMMNK
jgi:hypothetical protein